MTRTITITSGKGGVGKTSISVNLALHLAALGYRTCLFDADLGLANVNILLGLYPQYNLEDVILSHRDLKDVIIRNYEGIDIIPASSGVEMMANLQPDQVEHLIRSFSELDEYSFLVFDTSAGVSRNVISFCLASSEVIVVITPEVTSLTDAYALLKILCLNGFNGSVRIVVNQCKNTSIAKYAYTKLKQTVKKYLPMEVIPLGLIVQDPKVEQAVDVQRAFVLLYPESNASKCIKNIAKRLVGDQPGDLEPSETSSFWTTCLNSMTRPLKLTAKEEEKKETAAEASRQAQEQGLPQPIETVEESLPETSMDSPEPGRLRDMDEPADNKASVFRRPPLKNGGHLFKQIDTHRNLPSLPHVVLKLIEACSPHEGTIEKISQIVNKDPSLSARVMSIVNSAREPRNRMTNIEEAVFSLGRDGMKTIAVCAAAYSDFDQAKDSSVFELKLFWWHSFMCATLAKLIAEKTLYAAPDEAFLSGLLHDIGKLVLLGNFPKEYDEILQSHASRPDLLLAGETRLGATHCEVGAWMINQWNPRSFIADAILYHHEPVHRILDALPLVKIIFVANALSSETVEDTGTKFKTAEEVFGFSRSEVEELISLAEEEVKQVAESLDIEVEPPDAPPGRAVLEKDAEKRQDLLRAVRDISLLQGTLQNLLEAHGEESILEVVRQGLRVLFDAHSTIFFLYDQEREVLVGRGDMESTQDVLIKELVIPVKAGKCLAAKSLFQGMPMDSFGNLTKVDPTITDNQIIRLIGRDGILCLPMVAHKQFVGVIVIGIDEAEVSDLSGEINLLTMFSNQAALALDSEHVRETQARLIQSERLAASSAVARKVAHEVNNPLGIIKNYLKILGNKLDKDTPAQEEISIINEEIDRVSAIVRELSDFSEPGVHKKGFVDINALISDLIRIIHQSLLLGSNIKAHLNLEPSLPTLVTDKDRLKQVFINLIKNAVEAMPKGGNLYINTRRVSNGLNNKFKKGVEGGQEYVEITISDDGSGIPHEIRSRLFEPFVSSKGGRHAGLGLSIVYSIIRELNGTIACGSDETRGTSFKIVLPIESWQTR